MARKFNLRWSVTDAAIFIFFSSEIADAEKISLAFNGLFSGHDLALKNLAPNVAKKVRDVFEAVNVVRQDHRATLPALIWARWALMQNSIPLSPDFVVELFSWLRRKSVERYLYSFKAISLISGRTVWRGKSRMAYDQTREYGYTAEEVIYKQSLIPEKWGNEFVLEWRKTLRVARRSPVVSLAIVRHIKKCLQDSTGLVFPPMKDGEMFVGVARKAEVVAWLRSTSKILEKRGISYVERSLQSIVRFKRGPRSRSISE